MQDIYAVAANAYRKMMDYEMDQSILISGLLLFALAQTHCVHHILQNLLLTYM